MDPGTVLGGRFEVVRSLGRGGMADVVEARDRRDGRIVAIKVLRGSHTGDKEIAARFEREGKVLSGLSSPHVVRIFDVGSMAPGRPFIVMELLRGHDLAKELERVKLFHLEEATRLMAQACRGMIAAHEAGIVHRDLKPANIFLAEEANGKLAVKVLDFGISKISNVASESQMTLTEMVFGSPFYMPPEAFRSAKEVDVRSDIWSLGVMYYEMVTGTLPFVADNALGIALAVTKNAHVPACQRREELPRAVDVVIGRALKKAPKERYQSVSEFLAALEVFLPRGRNDTMTIAAVLDPDEDSRTVKETNVMALIAAAQAGAAAARGTSGPRATQVSLTDEAPTRVAVGTYDDMDSPTRVRPDDSMDSPTRVKPTQEPAPSVPVRAAEPARAEAQSSPGALDGTGRVAGPVILSTPEQMTTTVAPKRMSVAAWLVPLVAVVSGLGGWLVARGDSGPPPAVAANPPATVVDAAATPTEVPTATAAPVEPTAEVTATAEPTATADASAVAPDATAEPFTEPSAEPSASAPSIASTARPPVYRRPPPKPPAIKPKFVPTGI